MTVPITNVSIQDIKTELKQPLLNDMESIFEHQGIVEVGLDPTYCSGLSDLRTKPYEIGKWRNYTHIETYVVLSVIVLNASNGEPLNNVTVTVGDRYQAQTNVFGTVVFSNIPDSETPYLIVITKEGFGELIDTILLHNDTHFTYNAALYPIITGSVFILSWDNNPFPNNVDLDLYLKLPFSWNSGDSKPDTVYWYAKGSLEGVPYAHLDLDSGNGSRPETMVILPYNNGTYKLVVNRWHESNPIHPNQWNAKIRCYNNSYGTLTTVIDINDATYAPGFTNVSANWYVCDISGQNKEITIINRISDEYPV